MAFRYARWLRIGAAVLAAVLIGGALPAVPAAQTTDPAAAAAAGQASPPPADLDALIQRLEDPAAREELLALLRTLRDGGASAEERADAAAQAERLVATLADFVDSRIDAAVTAGGDIARSVMAAPDLVAWLAEQYVVEARRHYWLTVAQGLVLAFGLGLAAWLPTRLLVRRLIPVLDGIDGAARKLRPLLRLLLEFAPFAALFAGTALMLGSQRLEPTTVLVGRALLAGVVLGRLWQVVGRWLLAPRRPDERVLPLDDVLAWRGLQWWRAIGLTVIYGYFGLIAAGHLGMPAGLVSAIANLLGLAVAIMLTVLLLRAREPIAVSLRRFAAGLRSERLRSFVPWELIAGAGNIAAIALVWVHYAVWAVGVPGGFSLLLRATVLTIAVLAVANIASVWLEQRLTRPTPRPAEHEGAYEEPGETPGARRAAVLPTALLLVKALAAVAILHLWGIDIVGWFATPAGQDVLQRLLRIALICVVAFLIWTVIRRSVTTYLTAKDPAGNNRYSNRARTLANIARNAALVLIALFAFATVLSELGIETAPLLAGAGVAGLAIGFGAQRLVQDIITGLFILLGDTIRVGDVINVAGKGGAVESMSMRTVTLRGYDGAVHTIPYSAIDTVTNLTKDFSFWVFDIGVAYRESVDQVIAVLREIDAELRSEWPFRRLILEPLDIAGLDQFGESAIVVKARIKTRPGDQWRVGREFNRRIKRRFDELGIEIPFPHRTIYFGVDKSGAAPPLAIEHHRRGLLREEAATAAPPGEPRPAPQPVAAQARRGA